MNFQNNPSQFMSMGNWGQPSGQLPSLVSQAMPDLSGGFSPNPSGDFMSSFTSGTTPGGFEGFGGDYGNFSKPYEGGGFMEGMLGGNGKQGWGGMALGGAGALASAFMGMQQYGLAKHKGYGTKVHMDALRKYGPSPIHRMSFKPVLPHLVWASTQPLHACDFFFGIIKSNTRNSIAISNR